MTERQKLIPHQLQVKIDKQLLADEFEYEVFFDMDLYIELLASKGYFLEQFKMEQISLRNNHPIYAGYYNTITHSNNIFVGKAIDILQIYEKKVGEIIERKRRPKENDFSGYLITKRLSDYLVKADPLRARFIANKMLLTATQRKLNEVLLHETRHAFETSLIKGTLRVLLYLVLYGPPIFGPYLLTKMLFEKITHEPYRLEGIQGLMVIMVSVFWYINGLLLGYSIDPYEIRAQNFTKDVMTDLRAPLIISLRKKVKEIKQ
jgi:hypothetical protein